MLGRASSMSLIKSEESMMVRSPIWLLGNTFYIKGHCPVSADPPRHSIMPRMEDGRRTSTSRSSGRTCRERWVLR